MLNAIRTIKDFTQDMDTETFFKDEKTKSAVVRQLEIIGEAAKAVPADIRALAPEIDWRNIAGIIDILNASFLIEFLNRK